VQTAITDMRRALHKGLGSSLAPAVMNSRNWVLSLVMSHAYLQMMLGRNAPSSSGHPGQATPLPTVQADLLFRRAANIGTEDALMDWRD
jgi:hypothetical protein